MRRLLFSLLSIMAVAVGMLAFTPNPAPPPLALIAVGDSLTATVNFTRQGTSDSVIATYTGANISTVRHAITIGITDTALLIPSPFLSPGGSVTVTVTLTPYSGGVAGAPKSSSATYQRPSGVTITGFTVTSP